MTTTTATVSPLNAAVAARHLAAVELESATADYWALLADERTSFAGFVAPAFTYEQGVAVRARHTAAQFADVTARRELDDAQRSAYSGL